MMVIGIFHIKGSFHLFVKYSVFSIKSCTWMKTIQMPTILIHIYSFSAYRVRANNEYKIGSDVDQFQCHRFQLYIVFYFLYFERSCSNTLLIFYYFNRLSHVFLAISKATYVCIVPQTKYFSLLWTWRCADALTSP